MANETKRRLLLSKWETRVEDLREKLEETEEAFANAEDERDAIAEVLEQVKYWMHEPLVLQMPMRDPRVILRRIEDVLG